MSKHGFGNGLATSPARKNKSDFWDCLIKSNLLPKAELDVILKFSFLFVFGYAVAGMPS
jgi:hypothetical protein